MFSKIISNKFILFFKLVIFIIFCKKQLNLNSINTIGININPKS